MSEENLWDDEPFSDVPDEVSGNSSTTIQVSETPEQIVARNNAAQARKQFREQAREENKTIQSESETIDMVEETEEVEDAEEDYEDILSDATLRLEQGNLYKLIMNHELFEDSTADPKAIAIVQRQIRKFAKEQMEIMLGMRRESAVVERLEIDFPFNELEVKTLKALASAATKGASEHSDNYVPSVRKITEETPFVGSAPKINTIKNKTSSNTKSNNSKPLQSQPKKPVNRTKLDRTIDQIAAEEGVPRELLEENYVPLRKPIEEYTEQELIERNRSISKRRQTQVQTSNKLPMPNYDQMELLAAQRAMDASSSPIMSKILDAVKKMPIKNN